MRRQATDWEKIFAEHVSDKGLLPKICKEHLKFKNKKTTQFQRRPMTLVNTSPKKKYRWQVSIGKEGPNHMSSGKCKLQWWDIDTTTLVLQWPTSRALTAPSAAEGVERRERSSTLVGTQGEHTATVEGSVVASYKIKYILTVRFGNHPFMVFTLVESLCPHRKPCVCCVQHFYFIIMVQTQKQPSSLPWVKGWIPCGTSREWDAVWW